MMQRLICFGACLCITLIYLIARFDPSNILLWFISLTRTATFFHVLAITSLIFIGTKQQLEHTYLRRIVAMLGLVVLGFASVAMFSTVRQTMLPLDYVISLTVGISLLIMGLSLPETAEFDPYERHTPAKILPFSFADLLQSVRAHGKRIETGTRRTTRTAS